MENTIWLGSHIKQYTDTSVLIGYEIRRIRRALENGGSLSNELLLASIERIDKHRLKCNEVINTIYDYSHQVKNTNHEIKEPVKSNEVRVDPSR